MGVVRKSQMAVKTHEKSGKNATSKKDFSMRAKNLDLPL